MRAAILVGCVLLDLLVFPPDDPASLERQAGDALAAKNYSRCADLYALAIHAGATGVNAPYNAACCFALTGNRDEAFKYLSIAIQKGWRDVAHLEGDADLASLHSDTRWGSIVRDCKAAAEKFRKSITRPEIRDELLKRMDKDQAARNSAEMNAEKMMKVDQDNTAWMKEVVEKHGWPGKSMVGKDGAFAAWLLVQHADADPKFQAFCLELMKQAQEQDEVRSVDVAYLTDRVLVAQGKKQLYGTQFITMFGKMVPRPIEDEPNLDARRAKMGLGPFEDYKKIMEGRARGG
jgi:hypothetical protein